jgi:hypothetical protein
MVLAAASLLGIVVAGRALWSLAVARGIAPGPVGLSLTLGSAVCVAGRVFGGRQADCRPGMSVAAVLTGSRHSSA